MIIYCSEGLGNRVAAMANGLSRAMRIRFAWVTNQHCPASAQDLFPTGIPGVEFVAGDPVVTATAWAGRSCERWDAAADRQRADAAYAAIMGAMIGRARHRPQVAICGRFYRNGGTDPESLADAAAAVADGPVFLFADRHRDRIRARLTIHGARSIMPGAPELTRDLGRSRSSMLAYASDWQSLLAAPLIVACNGPASALHPARAAGRRIVYV